MPYIYSGKQLRVGKAWTDNDGKTYPNSWATADADTLASWGVIWEDPSPQSAPFDSKFYWGREADGTLIPRSIEDVAEVDANGDPVLDENGDQVITKGLKSNAIVTLKERVKSKLVDTDWIVLRAFEDPGKPLDATMKAKRKAVRDKGDAIEALILATTTLEDFMSLYDTPVDIDGEPTGVAPINDLPDVN